jgi:4-aminobutyrate aminotransferase-like enzyme
LQVWDNAAARGVELHQGLLDLQSRHDVIGDVRGGHGLMLAMELVGDRATKSAPEKTVAARVQAATYKAGAMVRVSGANMILSPPLVLTSADVRVILGALEVGFLGL